MVGSVCPALSVPGIFSSGTSLKNLNSDVVGANDATVFGTERYLPNFPYLGQPYAGYDVPADNTPATVSSY